MAFRLNRTESVSHGVKRVARKELKSAFERLQPGDPKRRDAAVHEGRKSIKKVRALLELVRDDLGRTYGKAKDTLRQAAQPLARERDADILLRTFEDLHARHRTNLRSRTWMALRRSLEAPAAAATRRALRHASIARTLNALDRVRHRSRSWSFRAKGFGALRPGLKRSFRRARQAAQRARTDPTAANLHRWRKRVKIHWYHARLVEAAKPQRLRPYLSKLHRLETWLGDHHNLSVLSEGLRSAELPQSMHGEVVRLCSLIERRQTQLQQKAFELGRTVYAEGSKTFVRRLKRYCRTWHAPAT